MVGGCSASAFAVQVLLQPRDQDGMASLGERGRRLPLPRGHDGDRGASTLAGFSAISNFSRIVCNILFCIGRTRKTFPLRFKYPKCSMPTSMSDATQHKLFHTCGKLFFSFGSNKISKCEYSPRNSATRRCRFSNYQSKISPQMLLCQLVRCQLVDMTSRNHVN